jgi:hypothetical protein
MDGMPYEINGVYEWCYGTRKPYLQSKATCKLIHNEQNFAIHQDGLIVILYQAIPRISFVSDSQLPGAEHSFQDSLHTKHF